jgi:hypothetical protein
MFKVFKSEMNFLFHFRLVWLMSCLCYTYIYQAFFLFFLCSIQLFCFVPVSFLVQGWSPIISPCTVPQAKSLWLNMSLCLLKCQLWSYTYICVFLWNWILNNGFRSFFLFVWCQVHADQWTKTQVHRVHSRYFFISASYGFRQSFILPRFRGYAWREGQDLDCRFQVLKVKMFCTNVANYMIY